MASLEQSPRYTDSFQEFEVPSYSSSIQQLQSLPPPISEEPSSFMDAPTQANHYDTQPTTARLDNQYAQPLYEQPTILEDSNGNYQGNGHTASYDQSGQQYHGYPGVEVEDKIKDILSRYSGNSSQKQEIPHVDLYQGNQIFDAPSPPQTVPQVSRQQPAQQIPRAQSVSQNPQVQQMQKFSQFQTPPPQAQPQQTQPHYPGAYSQEVHVNGVPQQSQFRARVVQNIPSQQLVQTSPPPPQRYQTTAPSQQNQQVLSPPGSPQIHQSQQSYQQPVQQQPVQQQNPVQQMPPPQIYQPQTAPVQYGQQLTQVPQVQTATHPQQANDAGAYLQLVQQQAIQFQMQNQQIQQLQLNSSQQTKEVLNQMQGYFGKITSYMERVDKRLNTLENTAQTILKNQKGNNDDVSHFVPKGDLEILKKMQEQMESDMEVAKRLQAELDGKFMKEKKEEKKEKKEKKERSKSSESSRSSSSSMSPSSMQECPICTMKVPFAELEFHVNQCLEGIEKPSGDGKTDTATQEKASFWRRVFGPGPKKDDANKTASTSAPTSTRLALPAPPTTGTPGMYPTGQDYYQMPQMPQMPFVYRGGYPQPQMVSPQMYPYPQQQIYYIPPNMQPQQGGKK